MSILAYSTPAQQFYAADKAKLEDYKTSADQYQTKVDAFNTARDKYNTQVEDYKKKADQYNAAVNTWNETNRQTPYEQWTGYVSSPGEFKAAAPTAPADPGFTQEEVDQFIDTAEGRAIRRAQVGNTARQVMTDPNQFFVVGAQNFGSNPEVGLGGMSGFSSTAVGFEEGGNPVVEMTQQELLDNGILSVSDILRNYAVAPDIYYEDAQKEWDRGNYGKAAGDYVMGLTGELPWSAFMAEKLANFAEKIEKTEEPAVRNYAEGGVAGLFQLYAEGGAVTAISDDALTEMRNKVMNDYGFDPVTVAMEEGVDPELLLRVMYTENRGRQGPVSEAGAIGLMQLMPGTAKELGVDPNNPEQNARGGARYLRQQLETFQSVPLALAAYNAGPGNVRKYGGVPPFEETRNYVAQIHGVDTGEILPDMNQFYTRVEGENPSLRPQMRPEGLGQPEYVPDTPIMSEYLVPSPQRAKSQILPQTQTVQEAPAPEQEEASMGDFYKQYAAYNYGQLPEEAGVPSLTQTAVDMYRGTNGIEAYKPFVQRSQS